MSKKETRIPIFRDDYRIARIKADLEAFCEVLNWAIAKFNEWGIYKSEFTEDMMKELAILKTDTLRAEVKAAYELEAAGIAIPFRRQKFLDGLIDEVYPSIDIVITQMMERLNRKCLDFYFKGFNESCLYISIDRIKYLSMSKGKAVYDKVMVEADNSNYASGEYFADFVKRTKILYQMMLDYDREVRILSGHKGELTLGIGEDTVYHDSIITVTDDKIHLDWRALRHIEFEDANQILSKGREIDNSKIWGTEPQLTTNS